VMPSIARVVSAATSREPSAAWIEAEAGIAEERRVVEALLADEHTKIYGFNTLLGQRHHEEATGREQSLLLEGHLCGPPTGASAGVMGLITAFKIEQLSKGGSGISTETYRKLCECIREPRPCDIAWAASYGSGDVVPAAWWLSGQIGEHARRLPAGDLIASINGNFVSGALGLVASVELARYSGHFLSLAGVVCSPVNSQIVPAPDSLEGRLLSGMAENFSMVYPGTQPPVSARDAGLYASPVARMASDLLASIEKRASAPSCNPRFVRSGGGALAISQASFLDVELTLRLVACQHLVYFCMGATQRFTQIVAELDPERRHIQHPKISDAYVRGAHTIGAGLGSYSGAHSEGLEDLWDGALIASRNLLRVLSMAEDQLAILEEVVDGLLGTRARSSADIGEILVAGLGLPGALALECVDTVLLNHP